MSIEQSKINWDEILEKFEKYQGSIVKFCEVNNISAHQLYYRRKRLKKKIKTTFCEIPLDKEDVEVEEILPVPEDKPTKLIS
ncbi:MAG: IS66 family insertion sequence element accessory protein TnpA, partial [Fusobacteriaceae bacterium]